MADAQFLDKIAQLSDEELKTALEKHGESVGPITSSTRYLFERLLRKKEGKPDIGDAPPNSAEGKVDSSTEGNCGNENGGLALQPQKPEVHVYFGVFPPDNVDVSGDPDFQLVYTDKMSCLAMMKKYRGSRFKAFRSYEEALQFAENGPDVAITQDTGNGPDGNLNAERPSPFRGPKSQDLVKFRKSIEKDDMSYFMKCINENPRYLVSSGDTPAILQEGSRYNALHVACRNNKAQYAAEVLSTVSKVDFFQKLYPDDTPESSERRSTFLLDLYLNTPDKGLNETPLHFASKHGSLECVRVLTSYPACNKGRRNKFGQTPSDIICSRVNNSTSKVREDIQCLLGEQFYIPLFRDDDHCLLPEIGRPWSPNLDSPTSPLTQDQLLLSSCSSASPMSPISPSLRVRGYAGPMSPSQAEILYRCWKENAVSSPTRHSKGRVASLRLTDQDKGLERIGRELAADKGISWNEYWEFLGDFANFRTEQGLQKLEVFLKEKYKKLMQERGQVSTEELAMKLNEEVRWEEEQSPAHGEGEASPAKLNDSCVSKSSRSTMSELCQELEALRLNVSLSPQYDGPGFKSASSKFLENWKEKEERQERGQLEGKLQGEEDPASEQLSYIMKSIRVAARRLAEVLGDLAQDLQSSTVANFSVTKTIRTKLKPEILCLKNVVSKCCTKELQTELEFGFIHILLAFKATEIIQENLTSSDISTLAETLKVFVSHLNFIQVHSSDEEDAAKPDITYEEKRVASDHFSCVVKSLEKALNIAYNNCNSDIQDCVNENGIKLHLMQMGDCRCRWDVQSEEHMHIPGAVSTPATASKYGKAFNFLHQTLFSNNRKNSEEPQSRAKDEAKEAIVKKLTFDEEGEEVIEASLKIRQDGDISETLINRTSDGAKEEEKAQGAANEKEDYAGDNDSFETAPSSVHEDMITPEEGIEVYMHGSFLDPLSLVAVSYVLCLVFILIYPLANRF
ncbi:uncharacterized protein LOC122260656 isoform X2 [Penaeus japonicus]|uniref:uncharacterized protein LOC122260656 isoform X2 n=1 Tax=Penaeus japonicus TaxID=27405 RepID=UPI001C70D1E8|nr:uncharacterized protein LOC122260656 isoform X2 [Penaeus japonicus]